MESTCSICRCGLKANQLLCLVCFDAWPRGKSLGEYIAMEYKPLAVVVPAGVGTAEDFPDA